MKLGLRKLVDEVTIVAGQNVGLLFSYHEHFKAIFVPFNNASLGTRLFKSGNASAINWVKIRSSSVPKVLLIADFVEVKVFLDCFRHVE